MCTGETGGACGKYLRVVIACVWLRVVITCVWLLRVVIPACGYCVWLLRVVIPACGVVVVFCIG